MDDLPLNVDLLARELSAIAEHQGPLNEDAVRSATTILALPRYQAASVGPEAQLVDDLKRVIADIPANTEPDEGEAVPWAVRYFRAYARRYFSLDGAGELLGSRRSFVGTVAASGKKRDKEVQGAQISWMNRAVIHRVLSGLVALWHQADGAYRAEGAGYEIEFAEAKNQQLTSGRGPYVHSIRYEVIIRSPYPQLLFTPLPFKRTTLAADVDAEIVRPPPQRLPLTMHNRQWNAVAFGTHKPGTKVRITVRHVSAHIGRWPTEMRFPVEQPMGLLGLSVEYNRPLPDGLLWEAKSVNTMGDEKVLEKPAENPWYCIPEVGLGYILTAQQRDADGNGEASSGEGQPSAT